MLTMTEKGSPTLTLTVLGFECVIADNCLSTRLQYFLVRNSISLSLYISIYVERETKKDKCIAGGRVREKVRACPETGKL